MDSRPPPAELPRSDVRRRGYSDEELSHIYELARTLLENGNVKRAESIVNGLIEVAPDFAPSWLAHGYIQILNKNYEAASDAARQALKANPESAEAMLLLVACVLTLGDFSSAGTYLGEIGELIESGRIEDPHLVRLYKGQLARYRLRS